MLSLLNIREELKPRTVSRSRVHAVGYQLTDPRSEGHVPVFSRIPKRGSIRNRVLISQGDYRGVVPTANRTFCPIR